MTNEQMRIAIAESCGLQKVHMRNGVVCYWTEFGHHVVPNYPNDLNAMHEVENSIQDTEWLGYCKHLEKIVGGTKSCFHATAHQRAEAYLRTKGLWTI